MDQTHARAIEALQPFIHLAKSNSATSPRFVAQIITNATSSPHTYVFAELLETPTIQSLASPDTPTEYQGYLKLLEIFAWGTWQEYQGTLTTSQPITITSSIYLHTRSRQANSYRNPQPTRAKPRAKPKTASPHSPHPRNNHQTPHIRIPPINPLPPKHSRP